MEIPARIYIILLLLLPAFEMRINQLILQSEQLVFAQDTIYRLRNPLTLPRCLRLRQLRHRHHGHHKEEDKTILMVAEVEVKEFLVAGVKIEMKDISQQ